MHARNVIAFFVWAWPSGFCDWSSFPWWATSWRGTVWSYRRQKGGSTPRTLIPVWTLPLHHISSSLWWPDPLPTGLNGDGKNVQTLWWAELDRLHSMTRAHPPLSIFFTNMEFNWACLVYSNEKINKFISSLEYYILCGSIKQDR